MSTTINGLMITIKTRIDVQSIDTDCRDRHSRQDNDFKYGYSDSTMRSWSICYR